MSASKNTDILLPLINSPADIKRLALSNLKPLAEELREFIIGAVSHTGGHLASNLGTVELTLALHRVYNTPVDKILWDTGHQSYAHKIITGRRDVFATLRQYRGIAGFLKREESEYDCWGAGHAGTAISAALGFASARDIRGGNEHVVAVVGDAGISNGMSLEALNHAGDLQTNFTVILNDNKMSIAHNVGALAQMLTRLRSKPWYQEAEEAASGVMQRLPGDAKHVAKQASKGLKRGITHYIAPENTGAMFEEMGFSYLGPIDGHNTELLIDVLTDAKQLKGPVLVHIITTKGKGYAPSEDNSRGYHGVPPFCVDDGKMEKSLSEGASFTSVFSDAMLELADEVPNMVALTAAMPDGTGLTQFANKYPKRFFDVGIAEEHGVCFSAGLAANGMVPVFAVYSSFMQRSYDQLLHDVCIQNLHAVIALDRAGLVGDDGPTHHGAFDMAILRTIPNLTVLAPSDGAELREMLRWAVMECKGPVTLRYPRAAAGLLMHEHMDVTRAEVLRQGDDICLLAVGSMVRTAMDASLRLSELGIEASVVNARTIKPLDLSTILPMLTRCKHALILEEGCSCGGFSSAVLEALCDADITDVHIKRLNLQDQYVTHGPRSILLEDCTLSVEAVTTQAVGMLAKT